MLIIGCDCHPSFQQIAVTKCLTPPTLLETPVTTTIGPSHSDSCAGARK